MKHRRPPFLHFLALAALPALYPVAADCQPTDCPPRDCGCIKTRAFDALQQQDFEGAVTKFAAWKTCDPRRSTEADSMTLVAFRAVDHLRIEAERGRRTLWANDLVNKSSAALAGGDRNAAFRLAEFACRFADEKNPGVINALMSALYYNDINVPAHHLPRHCNLEGHAPLISDADAIRGVAFSPDGQWLATASDDFTANIWDLGDWKVRLALSGHTASVRCLAFSPDGRWLATGSNDKTAKIWDLESGKERMTLAGHNAAISSLAFSPDGQWLATGSNDKTAKIWDLNTGKEHRTIKGHTAIVWSVAYSFDGQQLATGSDDKTAKIWDMSTGRELMTVSGHDASIRCMAFSPRASRLATGSEDGTLKIWSTETGKNTTTIEGHASKIWCLAYSPDGNRLATGHENQLAKIWDAESGEPLLSLNSHKRSVRSIAFSPDGTRLATGGYDNMAKVWELESNTELIALTGHTASVRSLAFSPACPGNPTGGRWLATGSDDGSAKIWDPENGEERMTLTGHTLPVRSLAFSPGFADSTGSGIRLATGSDDHTARIWDAESGKEIISLTGHASTVRSVAFSPGGGQLATGSDDKTAKLWDSESGKLLHTLSGHTSWVTSVAYAPVCPGDSKQHRLVATGSLDKTAKIWDSGSGKNLMTLSGNNCWVMCVAFSPDCTDGQRLVTGFDDGTIKIWDIETGKALLTIKCHQNTIRSIAFSPDGHWLATGANGGELKVWDMKSGKELMELKAHQGNVWGVAFSPDGQRLASCADDNTAIVWTVDAAALIKRWHSKNCTAKLPLLLHDVDNYGVASLLDVRPDNEVKLIETRETWQIAAFADLVAGQATGGNTLAGVRGYYDRADRLYHAALQIDPNAFLALKRCHLLLRYAGTSLANAQTEQAYALATEALQLRPDDPAVYQQVLAIISEALAGKEVSAGNFLNSDKRWELQLYGDYFFGKQQWTDAGLLYEKVESMEHSCEILTHLYQIADKTGQKFDLQRFLATDKIPELRQYAAFLYENEKWEASGQLYEKTERLKHAPQTLIRLHEISKKTGQAFDLQRFLNSENAAELQQYGAHLFESGQYVEAILLFEKAERLEHTPEILLQLYRLSETTGQPFDAQRFLAFETAAELQQYALYFYETGIQRADEDRLPESRQYFAHSAALYEKADRLDPAPETLLQLHRIAELTGQTFDDLRFYRSDNPAELTQYAAYFAGVQKEQYKERVSYLIRAVRLDEKLLTLDSSAAARQTAAQHYNRLGFFQLFLPDGKAAETALRRGLALDASNLHLNKNLCHALLLQDRYREAETGYLQWKDKPFGESDLPLCKDAFLDDLQILETQGIGHPGFVKIKELLEGNGGR